MHTRASRAVQDWIQAGTKDQPRSQTVLAKRLSEAAGKPVSQSTVSHIVNGELKDVPSGAVMAAFRDLLGIEVEWWIADGLERKSGPSVADAAAGYDAGKSDSYPACPADGPETTPTLATAARAARSSGS